MARQLPSLIQQSVSVLLRRGAPHGARSCTQKWIQRDLIPPRIHRNRYSTQSSHGRYSDRASVIIPFRQASRVFQSRLLVLIASTSAILLSSTLLPPANNTRFDSPSFGFKELGTEDQWSKVDRLIRRAIFYSDKGDLAEVYEAMQLAFQECERMGLARDEPFVLNIILDGARALFGLGLHGDALETVEYIAEMCTAALRDMDAKGVDADEVYKDYLDRSSKIAPDMTYEEYSAYQWGRVNWFRLLVQSEETGAEILLAGDIDERAIERLISVAIAIESEMGHDYSRAPDLPDQNFGPLSKLEILGILHKLHGYFMDRQSAERALPFSQRILALMQSTEGDRRTCAVVNAMRRLAVNLSAAGTELELREGDRTAKVDKLYSEARQWAEQALEVTASIRAAGDTGDHPLMGAGVPEEPACESPCIAILNLLAGMSLFIDKDEERGRRLLEEALNRAKPLGPDAQIRNAEGSLMDLDAQIRNAEGFLKDLDAGTVGSKDTLVRDVELFGYTPRLEREGRKGNHDMSMIPKTTVTSNDGQNQKAPFQDVTASNR